MEDLASSWLSSVLKKYWDDWSKIREVKEEIKDTDASYSLEREEGNNVQAA